MGLPDVANAEGWSLSLAYWFIAKNHYKNASIYNFSYRKLGKVLNISHTSAGYHFKVWKDNGLIVVHKNGTLAFNGRKAMDKVAMRNYENEKSCTKTISITYSSNVGEQEKYIKSRIIQKNVNQQARIIIGNREVMKNAELGYTKKFLSKSEMKSFFKSRSIKQNKNLKSVDGIIRLSDKKISELVGCSISYARTLKKFINEKGILKSVKVLGNMITNKIPFSEYKLERKYGNKFDDTFFYKGGVYEFPKTRYENGTIKNSWVDMLYSSIDLTA